MPTPDQIRERKEFKEGLRMLLKKGEQAPYRTKPARPTPTPTPKKRTLTGMGMLFLALYLSGCEGCSVGSDSDNIPSVSCLIPGAFDGARPEKLRECGYYNESVTGSLDA